MKKIIVEFSVEDNAFMEILITSYGKLFAYGERNKEPLPKYFRMLTIYGSEARLLKIEEVEI